MINMVACHILYREVDIMNKMIMGILSIVAGLLVIFVPHILQWVVGIFLIVMGVLMLMGKK